MWRGEVKDTLLEIQVPCRNPCDSANCKAKLGKREKNFTSETKAEGQQQDRRPDDPLRSPVKEQGNSHLIRAKPGELLERAQVTEPEGEADEKENRI